MDKMRQDSRKAFEVTVKIHILTLQWQSQFGYLVCPEGSQSPSLNLFFLNLSLEVWTEVGKKAKKDHALSGGKSLVQVWCSQLKSKRLVKFSHTSIILAHWNFSLCESIHFLCQIIKFIIMP